VAEIKSESVADFIPEPVADFAWNTQARQEIRVVTGAVGG